MSANQDSVSNQGEFHSRVPPSEPLTTKGHAPGVKVGNDAAPEFHAETLPAGTAPSDRTFQPQTQSEIPGQAMNPNISKETWTSASDTIGGATSADVHTGYGHPGSGQTSNELHGVRKKEKNGLAGVGADPTNTFRERGQDIDFPKGTKGKSGTLEERQNVPGAEEREPVSSEEVAPMRD
ncbi:uncharacterized protein LY89DRAFT_638532 [Mollisia scopiformis]|uniref:Uncharacterized protein n=1 Tax=Mollisia scopiformis TaxID=149040 RepID=A0A194XL74_MOLSC|nr:uncharacterized protein LY89DRAFT_638532 [Mollisia scopiformis]KUJ20881.1 hypothetical protein LY89DRAFT_638532 [Mollisia scopiformis]